MLEEYERLFLHHLKHKGAVNRKGIKIEGIPDEHVNAVYAGLYKNGYVNSNKFIITINPLGENYLLRLPAVNPIAQPNAHIAHRETKWSISFVWNVISNNQLISTIIAGAILYYLTKIL